jgi:hypothetical protein
MSGDETNVPPPTAEMQDGSLESRDDATKVPGSDAMQPGVGGTTGQKRNRRPPARLSDFDMTEGSPDQTQNNGNKKPRKRQSRNTRNHRVGEAMDPVADRPGQDTPPPATETIELKWPSLPPSVSWTILSYLPPHQQEELAAAISTLIQIQHEQDRWIASILGDEPPFDTQKPPQTLLDWQTLAAWVLVTKLKLTVFGGFLRDRLSSPHREAKDIDTAIDGDAAAYRTLVDEALFGLELGVKQGENKDGKYKHFSNSATVDNLYYAVPLPGDKFGLLYIQLVDKTAPGLSWSPDVTVNGLGLNQTAELHSLDPNLPKERILMHIRRGVYNWWDAPVRYKSPRLERARQRQTKMQERGFRLEGLTLFQSLGLDRVSHSSILSFIAGVPFQDFPMAQMPRPHMLQQEVEIKVLRSGGNALFDALAVDTGNDKGHPNFSDGAAIRGEMVKLLKVNLNSLNPWRATQRTRAHQLLR